MKGTPADTLIVAERRRKIHRLAMQNGAVKVVRLAQDLGVGLNTIRNDLDCLEREGKLIRSHGGAIAKEFPSIRPPYSETRSANMDQKARIGQAAVRFVPEQGSIFLGGGSTVYELATRIPLSSKVNIVTVSPEIALYRGAHGTTTVDLLGGRIRPDSFATDLSLSEEAVDLLYWDVTFIGVSAIHAVRGITSVDRSAAIYERRVIEHGSKTVVLCDSSKFGRFSYAMVGPIGLVDILVTDSGIAPDDLREITEQGVQVIIADSEGEPHGTSSAGGNGSGP